jgi:hypothetical protein
MQCTVLFSNSVTHFHVLHSITYAIKIALFRQTGKTKMHPDVEVGSYRVFNAGYRSGFLGFK